MDKTEIAGLIQIAVLDTEQMYICVSRPRRFGKSMAAKNVGSILLSRPVIPERLFQNLKIAAR